MKTLGILSFLLISLSSWGQKHLEVVYSGSYSMSGGMEFEHGGNYSGGYTFAIIMRQGVSIDSVEVMGSVTAMHFGSLPVSGGRDTLLLTYSYSHKGYTGQLDNGWTVTKKLPAYRLPVNKGIQQGGVAGRVAIIHYRYKKVSHAAIVKKFDYVNHAVAP